MAILSRCGASEFFAVQAAKDIAVVAAAAVVVVVVVVAAVILRKQNLD